jgi:hypothetical protein
MISSEAIITKMKISMKTMLQIEEVQHEAVIDPHDDLQSLRKAQVRQYDLIKVIIVTDICLMQY